MRRGQRKGSFGSATDASHHPAEGPSVASGTLPSRPALAAMLVWVVAAGLIQWLVYGPLVDLRRLTGLPLGFVVEEWRPALQKLLTAPLGT
jgi:hypothetical protein